MKAVCLLIPLLCLPCTGAKEKETSMAANEKILVLEPLKIQGSPIISYAIDITIYGAPDTKKVNRIFIARVLPDTDAARAGLQPGDEIVKLDGVNVKEFDAVVSIDSPLGKVLLNRQPGEPLRLEVLTRRAHQFTLRAQPGSWLDGRR